MVDFRPIPGREREVDREGLGRGVALLAVESSPSGTDSRGLPTHDLDVQVAMFDGVNEHLRRQSTASLLGTTGATAQYTDAEFISMVTAAWQQDDPMDPATPEVATTEQDFTADAGVGSVYAFIADVGLDQRSGAVRVVPGSIRRLDPDLVPQNVMDAQHRALEGASVGVSGPEVPGSSRSIESEGPEL